MKETTHKDGTKIFDFKSRGTIEHFSHWGLVFGVCAILLWSFGSLFIYLGGNELNPWHFVTMTSFLAGTFQMFAHRIRKKPWRSAVFLPMKLWVITLTGIVFYCCTYPLAIATSKTTSQLCGVNLINYLWPILTVIFATLWVPAVRFNKRLLLALFCVLAGLFFANFRNINSKTLTNSHQDFSNLLPYILAFSAAVAWSVYSSLLARWKHWAKDYMTTGVGFLITSLAAGIISLIFVPTLPKITTLGLAMVLCYGIGTAGTGYLLWELALTRANVKTLGMLAVFVPVLSTLWLCIFLKYSPPIELIFAAIAISIAIFLSKR